MSPTISEPTVSQQHEFVVGVDTHAATHTFALIAATTGALLSQAEFLTIPDRPSRARDWLQQRTNGHATLIVVQSTELFGAIVTERLPPPIHLTRNADRRGTDSGRRHRRCGHC